MWRDLQLSAPSIRARHRYLGTKEVMGGDSTAAAPTRRTTMIEAVVCNAPSRAEAVYKSIEYQATI